MSGAILKKWGYHVRSGVYSWPIKVVLRTFTAKSIFGGNDSVLLHSLSLAKLRLTSLS